MIFYYNYLLFREMLGLALLVAAAVNAAPVVEGKLPFLPEVFQNVSYSFTITY